MNFLLELLTLFVVFYLVTSVIIADFLCHKQLSMIHKKGFNLWQIPAILVYFFWALVFWPRMAYKRITKQPW